MKTLVTSALVPTEEDWARLRLLHCDIDYLEDEHRMPEHPEDYDAVICNSLFYYGNIRKFTKLRFVQLLSVGLDRIDTAYCRERGIDVYNAGNAYAIPMAEWTLLSILELYKYSMDMFLRMQDLKWKRDHRWRELAGKTAVIVGYGNYGSEVAKRLKSFSVKTIVVNRSFKFGPYIDEYRRFTELDSVLPEADMLILAVPKTKDTDRLINAERLSLMKRDAILVNAARGSVVDEKALVKALEAGALGGAALDVFEEEPLPVASPLWVQDNVIITPHNSFCGEGNHGRLVDIAINNLKAFIGPVV